MPSKTKKLGRERLQQIINLCTSIEEKNLDPFLVDVDALISAVKKYFPEWKLPEELCLDAEVIHQLASLIQMQSKRVKHQSTSLYTDPFLLEEKIDRLSKEQIVAVFLKVWRPIVALEQISSHSLEEAIKYWQGLLPLNERWLEFSATETKVGETSRDELIEQRIMMDKDFSQQLEMFWRELKQQAGEKGKIRYWNFVGADTYAETIRRAYMTSFLLTYGYATLEIHRLKEEVFIKPHEKPVSLVGNKQVISIPFSINREKWMKWKENELD
ncbi:MAG: hypothetical protein U9O89_03945 [Thermoproteota archaeon]|nr:hypothetical protein [Thermoproteota archaeon]